MEFICSDTNVWVDFAVIQRTELPFRLPYTYLMNSDAMRDELLSPVGLCDDLKRLGLEGVDLTMEEFELAESFGLKYIKLSIYDRIALAIAKARNITLLTGDAALRKAAATEKIEVIGTIWILDQLYERTLIDATEYEVCLNELQKHNGQEVRLPRDAISDRLKRIREFSAL